LRRPSEVGLSDLASFFTDFVSEPLAVEALLAAVALVVIFMIFRALRGVAGRISRRRALREFVGGLDAFFKGEYAEARTQLGKVLERDPENSEARILLGDACRELGDLAEAHKHHYQVARVFERDVPRNESSLGRDLLEMGRAEESGRHLSKAHENDPEDGRVLELLVSASLESGRYRQAADLAKKLERLGGGRATRLRAAVLTRAGTELIRRGEAKEGKEYLRTALTLNPSLVTPRLELVRTAWMDGSAREAEKELKRHLEGMRRLAEEGHAVFEPPASLVAPADRGEAPADSGTPSLPAGAAPTALPPPERAALPAPAAERDGGDGYALARRLASSAAPASTAGGETMPDAPRGLDAEGYVRFFLPHEAAYLCGHCGRPEREWRETCPECGRFGTLAVADPSPLVEVPEMREVFDEILENRAFVRTLVAKADAGDGAAAERLVTIGPSAVPAVVKQLLRTEDEGPLVAVLARMGPGAAGAIFDGWRRVRRISAKRLVRAARPLDHVVVRALVGMGDPVVPELTPLLDSGERDVRIVVLDVLIRLGRADLVEELRFAVPPKDILERLNACPPEDLSDFLAACTDGGFLDTQVLRDRTFTAEEALVSAVLRPECRTLMRSILLDRGFSSRAYERLEGIWEDPAVRLVVLDVARSYGRDAVDHLLKTATSPRLPEQVREDALGLLVNLGSDELERLLEHLAEGDPETEKAVLRIANAFGNRAVPTLVRAYGKTGLLGKMGLAKRRIGYRKLILLRSLEQIGTYEAIQGLRQIQTKEGDPDLGRRITGVLDRLSRGGGQG
jgi:tetratricopeptide (TPR) repeat protein